MKDLLTRADEYVGRHPKFAQWEIDRLFNPTVHTSHGGFHSMWQEGDPLHCTKVVQLPTGDTIGHSYIEGGHDAYLTVPEILRKHMMQNPDGENTLWLKEHSLELDYAKYYYEAEALRGKVSDMMLRANINLACCNFILRMGRNPTQTEYKVFVKEFGGEE